MSDIASDLDARFGGIDIYVFDQIARGRVTRSMRVLDAGCGYGRNLVFLLRSGLDVCGVDADAERIEAAKSLAKTLAPELPDTNFRVERAHALSFDEASFDFVICVALLHFAETDDEFAAMLSELWRVLRPGGTLFVRLATDIGIEDRVEPLGGRRYRLPDGTDRYLNDEASLLGWTERLGGTLLDPLKTTNVQGLRCMTTWVLAKTGSP